MSYDTHEVSASALRQVDQHLDLIANTLACSHSPWLHLKARLARTGKAIHGLTFINGDAIAAFNALPAQVRR
ncbi:hypothetical protein A7D16_09510 [Xanthomonas nasturtii]|uniref:hypothetical protein n=1 Tax=Xanthomonas nasturtii TaxID=1843581 RepID=UPI0007E3B919|nr:hypothetical protein [Xanthomonas nasturtii]MCL1501579.1 hypothetical protein [Xanthomonas nasturtii]MCL1505496.1 hypothetical protein [Xanthomonas nasturtii]MCL1525009.1 hypothetical protein [Xanthomonas nasturtii]MCL1528819.1 hypothetical protein [Xanthomonas nasturtii]MCL1536518.1 hypothetical protein [Xanthomonas nasturtii]